MMKLSMRVFKAQFNPTCPERSEHEVLNLKESKYLSNNEYKNTLCKYSINTIILRPYRDS